MYSEVDILLVEDNLSDAEMTVTALTQNNLANQLLHVKDGAEALDFLFAEGNMSRDTCYANPRSSCWT